VHIDELRGSNSLSITNIVHEMDAMLPAQVRQSRRIYSNSRGAGYVWSNEIELSISDYSIEKEISHFDPVRSDAAEHTYKTLVVVGLWQPVYPEGFNERCR
jgi:hypothetical protein